MEGQAVIAQFDYSADSLDDLYEVGERLESAINDAGVGEFDGHEIAIDLKDDSLYMYGPDAKASGTARHLTSRRAGACRSSPGFPHRRAGSPLAGARIFSPIGFSRSSPPALKL